MSYSHPIAAYKTKLVGEKRFSKKEIAQKNADRMVAKSPFLKTKKKVKKNLDRTTEGNYNAFYG